MGLIFLNIIYVCGWVCLLTLCPLSLCFRGACKSGKFLAQLVPAVSIPCMHVSVCGCVFVREGLTGVKVVSAVSPLHRAK